MSIQPSILIVDDEFGLAEMLREMLREYGYEVTLANNGRLALDILKERRIDLVITDVMMPVMDGSELATVMRKSKAHRDIPIVMMTSLPSAWSQHRELFDAVLRKPFTPALLMQTIQDLFRTNGEGPDGDRRKGPPSSDPDQTR